MASLPNHVGLTTVKAPTGISRAYGCGRRFAGTFTDTYPDVYSDAEFKSIINDKLMESYMLLSQRGETIKNSHHW